MAEEYIKGRDFISSIKLNYFHHFFKQLTGYLVHPIILQSSSSPRRIADLGTQTAVWSIDVAEDKSLDAEVDGFDALNKFFPPKQWLPENLRLHEQDTSCPFPADMLEKFDVVHLRMLITLTPEQLDGMIKNAITLLKPGGYIQWVEHDKTSLEVIAASPDLDTSVATKMIETQRNPFPNYNARLALDIAPAMRASGLDVVVEELVSNRKSMVTQMHELHLLSLVDVPAGLSKTIDEFKENYMDAMIADARKGVSTLDSFVVVVALKPE